MWYFVNIPHIYGDLFCLTKRVSGRLGAREAGCCAACGATAVRAGYCAACGLLRCGRGRCGACGLLRCVRADWNASRAFLTRTCFFSPTTWRFLLFRGQPWPALAFSTPRLGDFFFFGGRFFTALAFSTPRLGDFFFFGGQPWPALAFSTPPDLKSFLLRGQFRFLRLLHRLPADHRQCTCLIPGFCTDSPRKPIPKSLTPLL